MHRSGLTSWMLMLISSFVAPGIYQHCLWSTLMCKKQEKWADICIYSAKSTKKKAIRKSELGHRTWSWRYKPWRFEQTIDQQGQWCCGVGVWLSDNGVKHKEIFLPVTNRFYNLTSMNSLSYFLIPWYICAIFWSIYQIVIIDLRLILHWY